MLRHYNFQYFHSFPAFTGKAVRIGCLAFCGLVACFSFDANGAGDTNVSGSKNKGDAVSYWLHRISHHAEVSRPLLDHGYLSIGWSDFSNNDFIEKARAGDRGYFESTIKKEWGSDSLSRSRWSLWKYLTTVPQVER